MLNKDDTIQTDNMNFEGENEEADQAQFERSKIWHSILRPADRFSKFLFNIGFKRGKIVKVLFLKSQGRGLLIIQVYIDDIIFEATFEVLCEESVALINIEFWSKHDGRIKFFIELQIKKVSKCILVCQEKFIKELHKRFDILEVKTVLKRGNEIMKPCTMEDQVVDIFTKALSKDQLVKNKDLVPAQRSYWRSFHIMDAKTIDTPLGTNSKLDVDGSGPYVNDASVRIYEEFQDCPTESHLKAAKRILRCLKKIRDLVLFCPSRDFFIWRNMVMLIMLDIQLVERVPHEWLVF